MAKQKVDKAVSRNLTLKQSVHDYVVKLGESPKENRNFSNMVETLILEAKEAREKKATK